MHWIDSPLIDDLQVLVLLREPLPHSDSVARLSASRPHSVSFTSNDGQRETREASSEADDKQPGGIGKGRQHGPNIDEMLKVSLDKVR